LVAEQLLLALAGGGLGYALGILLARLVGQKFLAQRRSFICCAGCDYRPRRDRHATRQRYTFAASLAL